MSAPLDPHDRFLSTASLCRVLGVTPRGFRGSKRDKLLANANVRTINISEGYRGRRWHLGDVLAVLREKKRTLTATVTS